MRKVANLAFATLAGNITAAQTTISLTAGQGARFPALSPGDWFWGTLFNAAAVYEVVKVTAIATDTLTVQRGQDGTTASAYNAGDRFEMHAPAALWNDHVDWATYNANFAAIFTGVITLWSGAINAIPAHWHICDGTNGTPDLRDKFVVGAGLDYAVGANGGLATYSLTVNQLPAHGHAVTDPTHAHAVYDPQHNHGLTDPGHVHYVNDPGHAHSVYDPGHGHGITDPGHSHTPAGGGNFWANAANSLIAQGSGQASANPTGSTTSNATGIGVNAAGSNIGIYASGTGVYLSGAYTGQSIQNHPTNVSLYGAATGITIQNTGTGAAIDNRPPYYALAYIMYTG